MEQLQSLLQCPNCHEIPRDTSIVICTNGHTICSICKADSCRTCGGSYQDPPIRNFQMENLIEIADLVFSCKNASAGCVFTDKRTTLSYHEVTCEFRMVPCPMRRCQVIMEARNVVSHIHNVHAHDKLAPNWDPQPNRSRCWTPIPLPDRHSYVLNWASCIHNFDGHHFMTRFIRINGLYHAYVRIFGDKELAQGYEVSIKVEGNGKEMSGIFKISEVDKNETEIVIGPDCLHLTEEDVEMLRKENTSSWAKDSGLPYKIIIIYEIAKKV